ncbi:MAG TPA: hypothetical protein DCR93_28360 [Cytophagales bacterium]|nr:hypothetical protein [Cytophagales bacterium]
MRTQTYTTLLCLFFCFWNVVSLFAQPASHSNGASAVGSGGSSTSLTINSFSINSGTDRLIVACVTGATVSGVTFNSNAMTAGPSIEHTTFGKRVTLWYRVEGTSGSPTVGNVVASGTELSALGAVSYGNVDQATPIDGSTSAESTDAVGSSTVTNPSLSVASEAGDLVCDCMGHYDTNVGPLSATVGASQTSEVNINSGDESSILAMSHESGGASVSMDWTLLSLRTDNNNVHMFGYVGMNLNVGSLGLPVTWGRVKAEGADHVVELSWNTHSETNNDRFEVEHSRDGKLFVPIAEIAGQGNSQVFHQYRYRHTQPAQGLNYYRIRQVDFDGQFDYSPVVSEMFEGTLHTFGPLTPNPSATGTVSFYSRAAADAPVSVRITTLSGKALTLDNSALQGVNGRYQLDVSQLPEGVYFLGIKTQGQTEVQPLVIKK